MDKYLNLKQTSKAFYYIALTYIPLALLSISIFELFGKYLSFGITFGLIFQTVLNLSVVIGLIPVTGVTLPFLSYGGSSLLITMISIGIILNISRYEK